MADTSVHPGSNPVFFGATLTYASQPRGARTITIKCLDEADNPMGELSWTSPKKWEVSRRSTWARLGQPRSGLEGRILGFSMPAGAMDTTKTFRHQGYELLCCAKAVDSGKFAPALVVCKQVWPTRPRLIAVERGDYLTEDSAIDAAYAQGVEWILNYG